MPINFQPAAPVAPEINANFGAADQYNRIYPQLADLYASAGRNITQASAQTAQNFTQGNIASAENQTRRTLQGFQIDAEEMQQRRQIDAVREAQQRQIQAQQQAQAREQQFEMDRMMVPITQREQMEQIRRTDGLAEIESQRSQGILSDQQAGDARYELMTGIKQFQNRQQMQTAALKKAQAAQINEEIADTNKAQAAAEDFYLELYKKGVLIKNVVDPSSGKERPLAYDMKTGRVYNPFLEHAGKQDDVPTYDWAKALKDAKAEAEAAYPVQKDKDEEIRVSKERNDYIQRIMERDRYKDVPPPSAVPGLPSPVQQAPINPQAVQQATQAPSAQQPVQQSPRQAIDQELLAIAQRFPDPSKAPPEVIQRVRQLKQARQASQ